jgi:hypothetical protein
MSRGSTEVRGKVGGNSESLQDPVLIVMLSATGTARAQLNGLHVKEDVGLDSDSQPTPDSETQSTDKTTSQKTAGATDSDWHLQIKGIHAEQERQ